MEELDRVFIAIGVSKPLGDLEWLPGAVNSAKGMANWASSSGYRTLCINDEDFDVITVDLLRTTITNAIEAIQERVELKRIVIYFAGHGAAHSIGDFYWILTNWNTRTTEAIKVSALQRMLEYFGPKQVTIIGDACQEFSSRFIDVIGSAVLDKPGEYPSEYELDQFFAVDVGKQAFMVKGTNDEEAFCIFTKVLLDALNGSASEDAFEKMGASWVVTSQSLARHLQRTVSEEAGKHGVRMIPRSKPGFFTDCVYAKINPPQFPAVALRNIRDSEDLARSIDRGSSDREPTFDTDDSDAWYSESSSLDNRLIADRKIQFENFYLELNKKIFKERIRFDTGVFVSGIGVREVDSSFGELQCLGHSPTIYRLLFEDKINLGWSDVLLTLNDGRTYAVCVVQGFLSSLHFTNDGDLLSLLHHPADSDWFEISSVADLLGRLHSGAMREDEIIDRAAHLRFGKHRVVTMGCIAAQYYDAIRDVDSLRQMASFYAQHGQPIPLDIVLFGGGSISEKNGRLYATVPSVNERLPRTYAERERRFTHQRTPGFENYPIAGRIPWMRQAWSALATAVCEESARAWQDSAIALIEFLQPGEFTSVTPEGYPALCRLAGVRPSPDSSPSFVSA